MTKLTNTFLCFKLPIVRIINFREGKAEHGNIYEKFNLEKEKRREREMETYKKRKADLKILIYCPR